MNIFVLDTCPIKAAELQCDKHVVKMPLETAQMLSTIAFKLGKPARYKPTHGNHPCTIWAGSCKGNFEWLVLHGIALAEEYTARYGKRHKSQDVIEELSYLVEYLPEGNSPFVQCFPDEHKNTDADADTAAVKGYQDYYNTKDFCVWYKGNKPAPSWYKNSCRLIQN